MVEFDFGSLIPKETKKVDSTKVERKKPRISSEKLLKEINTLKKDIEVLKQEGTQERNDIPEEVYKGLWIMCRSFRSQYRNKSDSMLGQLNIVMNYFQVDLNINPFDKLKGSEKRIE